MVKNEQGQVALAYYQEIQKLVQLADKVSYVFVVKNHICMAWVNEQNVPAILAIKRTCCGGNKRQVFRYATETDVRRWTYGGR